MPGRPEVRRGVLVDALVAAADVAAAQADPEMDPRVAELDALRATLGGGHDLTRLPEMRAGAHRARAYTGSSEADEGPRQVTRSDAAGPPRSPPAAWPPPPPP